MKLEQVTTFDGRDIVITLTLPRHLLVTAKFDEHDFALMRDRENMTISDFFLVLEMVARRIEEAAVPQMGRRG